VINEVEERKMSEIDEFGLDPHQRLRLEIVKTLVTSFEYFDDEGGSALQYLFNDTNRIISFIHTGVSPCLDSKPN